MAIKEKSTKPYTVNNHLKAMALYNFIMGFRGAHKRWGLYSRVFFTITERILARWLGESYGLWEYIPWKWRNMSRTAGCFVFGFS